MKALLWSFLGTLLALIFIVLVIAGVVAIKSAEGPDVDKGDWLVVDLYGALPEYDPPADPLSRLLGGSPQTLTRLLESLDKAAHDNASPACCSRSAPMAPAGPASRSCAGPWPSCARPASPSTPGRTTWV